jgi:hypothetical protein
MLLPISAASYQQTPVLILSPHTSLSTMPGKLFNTSNGFFLCNYQQVFDRGPSSVKALLLTGVTYFLHPKPMVEIIKTQTTKP